MTIPQLIKALESATGPSRELFKADIFGEVSKRKKSFLSKVKIAAEDDCWEWLGVTRQQTKSALPYGRFYISKSKTVAAHRAAFMIFNCEDPSDKLVCHRCDNPKCCNPKHLWLGSVRENNIDREEKGRSFRGPSFKRKRYPHGVEHPMAVLTGTQAAEIRELYKNGKRPSEIAAQFGIHKAHVWKIGTGRAWNVSLLSQDGGGDE